MKNFSLLDKLEIEKVSGANAYCINHKNNCSCVYGPNFVVPTTEAEITELENKIGNRLSFRFILTSQSKPLNGTLSTFKKTCDNLSAEDFKKMGVIIKPKTPAIGNA